MVSKLGLEPEDQDFPFTEDTVNKLVKHGYTNEEFEHPYFDEQKEKLAEFDKFTEATHEKITQEQEVFAWLVRHGTITDNEARDNLHINRLAARIYNLRHRDGYPIETESVTVKRPNRRPITFAKYRLELDD